MKQKILSPIRKFYSYIKKDFTLLYKRKKYLSIFILLPILVSLIFLLALNPSDYQIKAGVCDFDNSEASKEILNGLNNFDAELIESKNCVSDLIKKIKKGEIDLGFEIGRGFQANIEHLDQSKIVVYYDNTDIAFSNLVSWKIDSELEPYEKQLIGKLNQELKSRVKNARQGLDIVFGYSNNLNKKIAEADSELEKIENMDTEFLTNPIWTDKQGVYENSVKSASLAFVFPVLALFIVLMLASSSIIYDRKTNFITRVKSSTSPIIYLFAKILFFVILVAFQFLIMFALFNLYGASYPINILNTIKLIFYIGIIDALLGFIIGMISENEGMAVLFSLIVSFPLMLVSGLFFPLQSLPRIIQWVVKILPLQYQINASKSVLLFSQAPSNNWLFAAAILFIVTYILIRKKN